MCAGDGVRWGNYLGVSKHYVSFGGVSLLERTIGQLRRRNIEAIVVVTHGSETPTGVNAVCIQNTTCLVHSILQTEGSWRITNAFLLGDVFYSDAAIDRILACSRPLVFFARPWSSWLVRCGHGEVFAFLFHTSCAEQVRSAIGRVFNGFGKGHPGNLWNLHHALIGADLGRRSYCRQIVEVVDDYTNDIDTPIDYGRRASLYDGVARGSWWAIAKSHFFGVCAHGINVVRRWSHYKEVRSNGAPFDGRWPP